MLDTLSGLVEALSCVRKSANREHGAWESVIALVRGLTGTPRAEEQGNAE